MTNTLFPVVILAGGLATRLRPITETIPKALISINNEPFIFHQLRLLKSHGIHEVILCLGFLGEQIEEAVGNGERFGLQVQYSYDGNTLLGTCGAIKKALPLLSDNFFVLYGDSYLNCNYAEVQFDFLKQQKLAMMTVFHNGGKWDNSNIIFLNGKILEYDKKNRSKNMHYIDYGLGVFTKKAFAIVPEQENYDLAFFYQMLLKQNELAAHEIKNRFYEVGSFTGIKELEYYLSSKEFALTV